jgi:hypothetical protein
MSISYSTKTCRLNGFVWIIFLFLFSFSCSDTKVKVDEKFEIDEKYELFLITYLDKENLESQIYFIKREYATCNKRIIELQNEMNKSSELLGLLDKLERYQGASGIDGNPLNKDKTAAGRKFVESYDELKAEKRKLNTIIKVAKKYGLFLLMN